MIIKSICQYSHINQKYTKRDMKISKQTLKENDKSFLCTEKSIVDYHPKKEYVVYYLPLQCCLKLGGFKIDNIHYVIKFKKANYMKGYIEHNHKVCCESDDKNDKLMYKLLKNRLFCRSLLTKGRLNTNIRIISDIDKAQIAASKDTFKGYEIIDDGNVLFNIVKRLYKIRQPMLYRLMYSRSIKSIDL